MGSWANVPFGPSNKALANMAGAPCFEIDALASHTWAEIRHAYLSEKIQHVSSLASMIAILPCPSRLVRPICRFSMASTSCKCDMYPWTDMICQCWALANSPHHWCWWRSQTTHYTFPDALSREFTAQEGEHAEESVMLLLWPRCRGYDTEYNYRSATLGFCCKKHFGSLHYSTPKTRTDCSCCSCLSLSPFLVDGSSWLTSLLRASGAISSVSCSCKVKCSRLCHWTRLAR